MQVPHRFAVQAPLHQVGKRRSGVPERTAGDLQNMTDQEFAGWLKNDNAEAVLENVAAGDKHTLFVTDKGRLFVVGEGGSGQLGIDYPDLTPVAVRGTPDCNESAALHSYGLDSHCR